MPTEPTDYERDAVDLLRRILAKTDSGPNECFGLGGDGVSWKGSFRQLLWEAHDIVAAHDKQRPT
jgi:hypothetical protein